MIPLSVPAMALITLPFLIENDRVYGCLFLCRIDGCKRLLQVVIAYKRMLKARAFLYF